MSGGPAPRLRVVADVAGATGPFEVHAELWYQPIGFRWAENLGAAPAAETTRFTTYYRAMASASATRLARAVATAAPAATVD